MNAVLESPAEAASRRALAEVFACLAERRSFRLEAGAGAGKTYSLIEALKWLISRNQRELMRRGQRIACITYTNVAKDEILARVDRSPLVYCETNHAFCWSLISAFQQQLCELLPGLPEWQKKMTESGVETIGPRRIEYTLGHRSLRDDRVSLHHDDVLPLTIGLMQNEKFCRLVATRYPVILVDEYQDTDAGLMDAIKEHFLGGVDSPQFGFFGDHWQKIYGEGCGYIEHPALTVIGKEANFRSVPAIVDVLNRMRPELPQAVKDPDARGDVRVFHSNNWRGGARRTGAHWAGDLPAEVAHEALDRVKDQLVAGGWDLSPQSTKILMLTHRVLASEQGYASLPVIFQFNSDFAKKEHPYIAYFVDVLEPACDAYAERKYGAMFEALDVSLPKLRGVEDKARWSQAMDELAVLRERGSVGDVLALLRRTRRPRLPDAIEERERELDRIAAGDEPEVSPRLQETIRLKEVAYSEIRALRKYLEGFSPFETKHGVKGAQFENVIVVVGRGWSQYNFGAMLEQAGGPIAAGRHEAFERNRNLFYVACSRPKRRLAVLFTQELSPAAMRTLSRWFGDGAIEALAI